MVLNLDIAPTILTLAGVKVPACMQGCDLGPLVQGERPPWRKDFFYEHHFSAGGKIPRTEGVRTTRYKYLRYLDARPQYEELYDLKKDAHETANMAGDPKHRPLIEDLRKRCLVLKEEAGRKRKR
jgi:arylsulfatase A-like enzyme